MIVTKWSENYVLDQTPEVSTWVRFHTLSMQFWGSETLSKLASQLGTPVEMDMVTRQREQTSYARHIPSGKSHLC